MLTNIGQSSFLFIIESVMFFNLLTGGNRKAPMSLKVQRILIWLLVAATFYEYVVLVINLIIIIIEGFKKKKKEKAEAKKGNKKAKAPGLIEYKMVKSTILKTAAKKPLKSINNKPKELSLPDLLKLERSIERDLNMSTGIESHNEIDELQK